MTNSPVSTPIESLCVSVTSGGTPSRARDEYWSNGTIPWLKTGELRDCRLVDAEEKITEEGLANSSAKVFPMNTVLMAMYGDGRTITGLGILEREMASNQACCAMIADPARCDYRYLYYALMHHRRELLGLVVAGAQRNLGIGIIKRFSINTFSLEAQHRIASILSAYDDLIENNRRRIQLLEQAARLIYQEWFVRLRFPGHEHVRVVDRVPEGWELAPLSNALILQRGYDLPSADRREGTVPVLASTGVAGTHDSAKVRGPGVVTGRSGTLGVVTFEDEDFWPLNTALWVKEFKRVSPYFAYFMLREMRLEQYNGGASVPTLDRKAVHRVPVLIPPASLVQQFDEQVRPIFRQGKVLGQLSAASRSARDLLLLKLMSGEIEV